MPKMIDTLGTPDEHGVYHINRGTKGCPHCNHVDVKFDATGTIALWHPGAECCEERLKQQIQWRQTEMKNGHGNPAELEQQIREFSAKISKLRHETF